MLIILFFKFLSIFLSKVVPGFRFDVFRYFFGRFSIVHDNYILKLFQQENQGLFDSMKSPREEEQHSRENIQQQLTVQDINLRREIEENADSMTKYGDLARRQSITLKPKKVERHIELSDSRLVLETERDSMQIQYKTSTSVSNAMKKQAKINSLAYYNRSKSLKKENSIPKKTKLNVSLSVKNKTQSLKGCHYKEGQRRQATFFADKVQAHACQRQPIGSKIDKENQHQNDKASIVKIQQPIFHTKHPVQGYTRYNGSCLSRIIMQRALLAKNC